MRLPSIFIAMALILLGGIVSVRLLEQRVGGFNAPGIVVVDAPRLGPEVLRELGGRWPGARVETVSCPRGPLQPFGLPLISRLSARGDVTALFTVDPAFGGDEARALPDGRQAWRVVMDPIPQLPPERRGAWVGEAAATFLRAQVGMRAFMVGVALGGIEPEAGLLLASLASSLESLPSYRRSSLVILGEPRDTPAGWRRPVLRLDTGQWNGRARPELADLLVPGW